ncbi:unnamed protein product [Tilletia controversa]|nr:unnamed protein product [Tilletia caries]CAD6922620.1 unnamed protein product [Tilletia controversa]CAD6933711.1 unnamed protein product [Tilletia controversa]CAD7069459.1 unnamed protein product [Tilletia caries]
MQLTTLASMLLVLAATATHARDETYPACDRANGAVDPRARHTSQPVKYTGEGTGACGFYHGDSDYGVCVSPGFVNSGNRNHCGDSVQLSHGGNTVVAKVVDVCGVGSFSCDDLYLTKAAFKALGGDTDKGRIDDSITWKFLPN